MCPIYKATPEIWIVGNEHLCFGTDIEFTRRIGRMLAQKLFRFKADCILTPEAKSLGFAFELAQRLGHKNFAIARKSIRRYQKRFVFAGIKSITSAKKEFLYLDDLNLSRIKGKRIVLFDDVISTGSTMQGLQNLAKKAKAKVCAIATIWLEGYWPLEEFFKEFKAAKLIYLDIFPLFSRGKTQQRLLENKLRIERLLKP